MNSHDFDCAICMDSMVDPVSTPCGHNFCKNCLSTHISLTSRGYYSTTVTCPSCRAQIQSNVADLRVNTGLRDMILRNTSQGAEPTGNTTAAFVSSPCTLNITHTTAPAGNFMVHCAVTPPEDGPRQPIVAILCLDLSGSMGMALPNPTNEKGAKLFTRLDLAKHVCVTTAHMLSDTDILCIIGFSTTSTVVLKPTLMTQAGKENAERVIKTVNADGGTNIWSALQLMNKVSNKSEFAGRNIVAALLTDGEITPGTSPRQGEVVSYRMMNRPEKLSIFGFGYAIGGKLLASLASVSNCMFGFIPDFSMVGTVFINWMATAISTASLERTVKITYKDGSTSLYKTGLIQFGQTRNIVGISPSEPLSASLDSEGPVLSLPVDQLSQMAQVRFELLNILQFCIGQNGNNIDYTSIYRKWSTSPDEQVRELLRDIKPAGSDDQGQVSMASSSPAFWEKWGNHYTRAYYTAVLQEVCMNFKDPGLQVYGGKPFQKASEAGDEIFRNLPAPEPTGGVDGSYGYTTTQTAPAVPQTLAHLHDAGGGCWAPGTEVRLLDGTTKLIEDIRRGDVVWTPSGGARVEHAIALGRHNPKQLMVPFLSKVWITPWHPVLHESKWIQPASLHEPQLTEMPVVYNMVLDIGHIISVNGVLSVTLGHGFTGPVIEHDFFGNKESILSALSKQPGFAEGRPVFQNLLVHKTATGLIVGWYDDV